VCVLRVCVAWVSWGEWVWVFIDHLLAAAGNVKGMQGDSIKERADKRGQIDRISKTITDVVMDNCAPLHATYNLMRPVIAMIKREPVKTMPRPTSLESLIKQIKNVPSTGEITNQLEQPHEQILESTITGLNVATATARESMKGGHLLSGNRLLALLYTCLLAMCIWIAHLDSVWGRVSFCLAKQLSSLAAVAKVRE
jgi:hypothetical protein